MNPAVAHVETSLKERVDHEIFRTVIGNFASGVTVITTADDGERSGSTASAVCSLSLDPPMLLVCLNQSSMTAQSIRRTGRFVVNVLADGQGDLAYHFAGKAPDKFAGIDYTDGQCGPVLLGTLAHIECEVADMPVGGSHIVFLADVVGAHAQEAAPLAYFRGQFGGFVAQDGLDAQERLRALVLARALPLDRIATTEELVDVLDCERAAVVHAANRLIQEGLLEQVAGSAYRVAPVDARVVEQALRARAALTLGVLSCVPVTIGDAKVEAVRRAASRASIDENPAQTSHERRQAIIDFHEALIGLADNELVLDTYRRLSVPSTLARVVSGTDWSDLHRKWSRDRIDLAEIIAARDFPAAHASITAYTEDVAQRCAEIIEARGGRI